MPSNFGRQWLLQVWRPKWSNLKYLVTNNAFWEDFSCHWAVISLWNGYRNWPDRRKIVPFLKAELRRIIEFFPYQTLKSPPSNKIPVNMPTWCISNGQILPLGLIRVPWSNLYGAHMSKFSHVAPTRAPHGLPTCLPMRALWGRVDRDNYFLVYELGGCKHSAQTKPNSRKELKVQPA